MINLEFPPVPRFVRHLTRIVVPLAPSYVARCVQEQTLEKHSTPVFTNRELFTIYAAEFFRNALLGIGIFETVVLEHTTVAPLPAALLVFALIGHLQMNKIYNNIIQAFTPK